MTPNPVIDSFDSQCLGEIHRLLERLIISASLAEDCIDEFETILGINPRIGRGSYFG